MKQKNVLKTILVAFAFVVAVSTTYNKASAEIKCKPEYGGGETCIVNKRFRIEKEVRLEGDDTWRNKVSIDLNDEDESDKYIEFRIEIKNLSDEYENLDFDDMKMKDILPDELERIGGSGLTEYWDDFEPGETKKFTIKAEIDEDEVDEDDIDTCVVNKAEVYWDGEFEGSDTATVCFSKEGEVLGELPKTGSLSTLAIAGLGLVATGAFIKKSKKVAL